MKRINVGFYSHGELQDITVTSLEEIEKWIGILQNARRYFTKDKDVEKENTKASELSSYILMNSDGNIMGKVLAERYAGTPMGDFHVFYEKDKIIAVVPASWSVIKKDRFNA